MPTSESVKLSEFLLHWEAYILTSTRSRSRTYPAPSRLPGVASPSVTALGTHSAGFELYRNGTINCVLGVYGFFWTKLSQWDSMTSFHVATICSSVPVSHCAAIPQCPLPVAECLCCSHYFKESSFLLSLSLSGAHGTVGWVTGSQWTLLHIVLRVMLAPELKDHKKPVFQLKDKRERKVERVVEGGKEVYRHVNIKP